jgi:hypothetical protein
MPDFVTLPAEKQTDTARQILEEALARGATINIVDAEMMTVSATCAFFGGDKPINPSTLYRGIRAGRYPPPVKLGGKISRWRRSKCAECRDLLAAQRADTSKMLAEGA